VLFYLKIKVTKNDVVVPKGRWQLTSMRFEPDDGFPRAGNRSLGLPLYPIYIGETYICRVGDWGSDSRRVKLYRFGSAKVGIG